MQPSIVKPTREVHHYHHLVEPEQPKEEPLTEREIGIVMQSRQVLNECSAELDRVQTQLAQVKLYFYIVYGIACYLVWRLFREEP